MGVFELILACVCGSNRGMSHQGKALNCFVVLLCTYYFLAANGLFSTNGMQNPPEFDACPSSGEKLQFQMCTSSHNSFERVCFRSMLSGVSHNEESVKAVSLGGSGSQCDTTEVSNFQESCKLVILTNDTTSSQVEVLCGGALHICLKHQRLSFIGIKEKSNFVKSGNVRVRSAIGSISSPPNVKVWLSSSLVYILFYHICQ